MTALLRRPSSRLTALELGLATTLVVLVSRWAPLPAPTLAAAAGGFALMAALFLAVEELDIKLDLGASSHALTLSELPFALGALTIDPRTVIAARVCATLVHGGLVRRQPTTKLAFNLLQHAATVAAALTLVRAIDPSRASTATGLLALGAGCALLAVGGLLAVMSAIRITSGTSDRTALLPLAGSSLLGGVMCALVSFFVVLLVRSAEWTLWPLVVLIACAGVAYASYVHLQERHSRLTTLVDFMTGLEPSAAHGASIDALLARLRDLFNAEQAALLVLDHEGSCVEHTLDDLGRRTSTQPHSTDWVLGRAVAGKTALLLPRSSADSAVSAWLAARGAQDALVSPFPDETGLRGAVVVAGRRSTYGSFMRDDLRVLEGVTRHAAVTFQAAGLLQRLLHESRHDALTGLPNRAAFRQRVDEALAADPTAAVLLMDLDRFKDVNDTLGHQAGDLLLQEVARRLSDALPSDALLARLGGDEFAVLLPGLGTAAALGIAARLRASLATPVVVDWLTTKVGASIGIAVAPEHGTSCTQLQRRADLAMYAAKAATGLRIWSEELDDHGADRLALLADLRTALAEQSLEVHFQPKASTDGTVVGVEGLLRWAHPSRGWIPPDVFVPLAETSELLPTLTDFVLERSLEAVRTAVDSGHPLEVAVNLSVRDLLDDTLPERVASALHEHAVAPQLLTLEITENAIMEERERCIAVLRQLRALGVRLSIDDFGTGYSSLAYLRDLPVQEVKLDRSFIRDLSVSPADQTIVAAVVQMARGLDLVVVAEGVEDESSWGLLQAFGCDQIQGWHLAPALALPELLGWLTRRRLDMGHLSRT